jgi:hypothetical protein
MARLRYVLAGALLGLTWAASLRGFMREIAGPDSAFSFSGTFGIILPAGALTGALLGWAAWQHQAGRPYRLLVAAPLLVGVLPVAAGQLDPAPAILAGAAMIGGYAVCGRGPGWARLAAGILTLAAAAAPFAVPRSDPDLSVTTAHGAWIATLGSCLFLTFALACAIPMRPAGQAGSGASPLRRRRRTSAVSLTDRSSSGDSRQAELTVKMSPPRPSRTRLTSTGSSASGRTITSPTSTSSAAITHST